MRRFIPIFTIIILSVSCKEKNDPTEQTDFNNRLVSYYAWDYSTNTQTQLIDLLQNDSVKYSELLNLHESTKNVLEYLENLKGDLIDVSGGYAKDGLYVNPNETEATSDLLLDNGRADELQKLLDNYSEKLKKFGLKNSQISLLPQQNLMLKHNPTFRDSTFEELHFENTPLIDCLTVIENYKMKVLLLESLTINLALLK